MKTKEKRLASGLAVLLLSVVLTACGSTETPSKAFKSADETVSIQLSDKWETEEEDIPEGWILAGNTSGSEAMLLMQFPKELTTSMEDFITEIEENYNVSEIDAEAITDLTMPGVSLTKSYISKVNAEGISGSACIAFGESEYAYYGIIYAVNKLNNNRLDYFKACCATFHEDAPETEITDTIRWFNATSAILTVINGEDYNLFGGVTLSEANRIMEKQALEEWWEVTDRVSAEETIEWLLKEGHRAAFTEDMKLLTADGIGEVPADERAAYIYDNYDMTEEEAANYAAWYTVYEENGEKAIAGWDLGRAMNLFGWYYVAGYYTREEALEQSLVLGKHIQSTFASWDEFTESYLLGYEYWAEESSDERRAVYEEIKAAPDSPYNLDWNMPLEKSW